MFWNNMQDTISCANNIFITHSSQKAEYILKKFGRSVDHVSYEVQNGKEIMF